MEINTAKQLIDEIDDAIPNGPDYRDAQRFDIPVYVVDQHPRKIVDIRLTAKGIELVIQPFCDCAACQAQWS